MQRLAVSLQAVLALVGDRLRAEVDDVRRELVVLHQRGSRVVQRRAARSGHRAPR